MSLRIARLAVALLLIGGSVVMAADALYELVRTGNCGTLGGATVSAPCPEGTGGHIVSLVLSVTLIPFVGMAIAPFRSKLGLAGLWWCFLWIAMGAAALVAGHGPAAPPDVGDGATIIGITFLVIGDLSLFGGLAAGIAARRGAAVLRQRANDASAGSESA